MEPKFVELTERLHPSFPKLISQEPVMGGKTPAYGSGDLAASRGVYMFTEDGRHRYVGRSKRLFERYKNHRGPAKTERQAAFAFKLARETTTSKPLSNALGLDR